jgi:alcohol dehydrogenase (cytochrome c)
MEWEERMNCHATRAGRPAYRRLATAISATALLTLPVTAFAATGPSADDFLHPSGAEWILPAGDYSGNREVKESEITGKTVGDMQSAWTFKIPDDSPIEASPIEWHGTVYLTSAHDEVYAIDAKSGTLKWRYAERPDQLVGFQRNRGVALLDGNVYVATLDGHIVALDAQTGKKVWDKQEVKNPKDSFYTMQPVPYKGMLILGASNGDWGGRGEISAFDPKDGKRLWQWITVPGPGDPANKTWEGDSWKRGGAAVWNGVAIDPGSNTLYIDTGNPQPDFLGAKRKGKNLYTDSMIALDISGAKPKMKWYHQFIAHDTHDWDPAMPPLLFTAKVDNKERKLVAAGDKGGNFWILDATTGKLLHHLPVSYQFNHNSHPTQSGNFACPNTNGGVEYNGGAYDPVSNTIIVPSINQCGQWKSFAEAPYIPGQFYLGGKFPSLVGPNYGWLNGIDANTGMMNWRHYFDLPASGGALVMTNGSQSIVFTGQLDGEFDAFDAGTGKLLWHHDTGASIIAPPATYAMDGERYVVVASGQPGFLKVPEMKQQMGPAVLTAFVSKPANATVSSGSGNQGASPTGSGSSRSTYPKKNNSP